MKLAFFLTASAMLALAVTLLLVPLLRQGRRVGSPRSIFALALALALALPLAAVGLYLKVGQPTALNEATRAPTRQDIDQAIADLRAHLAQQPNDLQGWLLLAQTAHALHQPALAQQAEGEVLRLAPDDTRAMVAWAEAYAQAHPDHRIAGHARELLERAVREQPDNPHGLWLLGISQFQASEFDTAAATWKRLLPLLEPGSNEAHTVEAQIAAAEAQADHGK